MWNFNPTLEILEIIAFCYYLFKQPQENLFEFYLVILKSKSKFCAVFCVKQVY